MPSTRRPAAGSSPSCPWMPAGGLSPVRQSLDSPANPQPRRVVSLSRSGPPPQPPQGVFPQTDIGDRGPPQDLCKLTSLRAGASGGRDAGRTASTAAGEKSNRGYSPACPGGRLGSQTPSRFSALSPRGVVSLRNGSCTLSEPPPDRAQKPSGCGPSGPDRRLPSRWLETRGAPRGGGRGRPRKHRLHGGARL